MTRQFLVLAAALVLLLLLATFTTTCAISESSVIPSRIRGQNGRISLLVAVPLTKDNQTVIDPGFFHLAAAQLAIDHFNSRNASVIKEFAQAVWQDCPLQFGTVQAVDTGTHSHNAMEQLVQRDLEVDAIAGPYHEIPALELSVLATGLQAPMVAQRVFDNNLLLPARHPYFNQVGADFYSEMTFVATYLQHVQRTNYVAVLYSTTASVMQKVDILRVVLQKYDFSQVRTFSYSTDEYHRGHSSDLEALDIRSVLRKLKATGFRTIVWMPTQVDTEAAELGPAATELGLDQGDHFWIVSGGVEDFSAARIIRFTHLSTTRLNAHFLRGATYLFPYDGYELNQEMDFRTFLRDHDAEFMGRVQQLNPIPQYFHQHMKQQLARDPTPFATLAHEHQSYASGTSFMYDAIMSIGMGACEAVRSNQNGTTELTGKQHLEGIQSLDFIGASGRIIFGNMDAHPGSRVGDTVPYTVANLVPAANRSDGLNIRMAESLDPVSGEWVQFNPYIYADGSQNPPVLLRAQPEQNYISTSVRAAGMALFAIALTCVVASSLWVILHRNHPVVVAAQPPFLYILCAAAFAVCFCILISAFDESWGFSQRTLDRACIAWTWIDALGSIISYSAIFTKLWIADSCFRYRGSKQRICCATWPCCALIVTVVILLSVWTSRSNYGWVREPVDELSGESVGFCNGEHSMQYMTALYSLHFIPVFLAGVMAWRTLGIDDLYSDAKWVLALILVQMQVLLVAIPVISMLDAVNPNGRYLGIALFTFTFPMSTMGLIILPKVFIVRQMDRKATAGNHGSSVSTSTTLDNSTDNLTDAGADDSSPNRIVPRRSSRQQSNNNGPRIQIVTFD